MPTGYTAGILDGTTKTFNAFAKLCTRAFIVHLRDEPMNAGYKKREPSDYNLKRINDANDTLSKVLILTDDDIIITEKARLIESKKHHIKSRDKDELNLVKMNEFLGQAKAYKPPTGTHNGIAEFMIEQLEKTIEFDCNSTYHIEALKTIDNEIENVNAEDIRSEMRISATKDIAYHTKEHEEELKRCRDHNKWYEDFINSLK